MSLEVQNKLRQKILKNLKSEGYSIGDTRSENLLDEYAIEFYVHLRYRVFSQVYPISSSKKETIFSFERVC